MTLHWVFCWLFVLSDTPHKPRPFLSRPKSAPSGRDAYGSPASLGRRARVSRLTSNGRGISVEHAFPTGAGNGSQPAAAVLVAVECVHRSDQIKQPISGRMKIPKGRDQGKREQERAEAVISQL